MQAPSRPHRHASSRNPNLDPKPRPTPSPTPNLIPSPKPNLIPNPKPSLIPNAPPERVQAAKAYADETFAAEEFEGRVVSSWGPYTSIVGTATKTGVAGLTAEAELTKTQARSPPVSPPMTSLHRTELPKTQAALAALAAAPHPRHTLTPDCSP